MTTLRTTLLALTICAAAGTSAAADVAALQAQLRDAKQLVERTHALRAATQRALDAVKSEIADVEPGVKAMQKYTTELGTIYGDWRTARANRHGFWHSAWEGWSASNNNIALIWRWNNKDEEDGAKIKELRQLLRDRSAAIDRELSQQGLKLDPNDEPVKFSNFEALVRAYRRREQQLITELRPEQQRLEHELALVKAEIAALEGTITALGRQLQAAQPPTAP